MFLIFFAAFVLAGETADVSSAAYYQKRERNAEILESYRSLTEPPPEKGYFDILDDRKRSAINAARFYYLKRREYDKALKIFDRLIQGFPKEANLWIERANVAVLAGRREDSLHSLRRAFGLPVSPEQRREIALLYQSVGELSKTDEILNGLIREFPRSALYHNDMGILQYLEGDKIAAEKSFQTALRLQGNLLISYLSLGALYASEKRYEEALKIYGAALAQKEPQDPENKAAIETQKRGTLGLLHKVSAR